MVSTEVFITCAVTGSGDTIGKSDKVPVTPEQIANDAIEAAKAGAAIAHCHVRDPEPVRRRVICISIVKLSSVSVKLTRMLSSI